MTRCALFYPMYINAIYFWNLYLVVIFVISGAFDQEYLIAFEAVSESDSKLLLKCDYPLSVGSQYCRHLFKELELSNYKW